MMMSHRDSQSKKASLGLQFNVQRNHERTKGRKYAELSISYLKIFGETTSTTSKSSGATTLWKAMKSCASAALFQTEISGLLFRFLDGFPSIRMNFYQ